MPNLLHHVGHRFAECEQDRDEGAAEGVRRQVTRERVAITLLQVGVGALNGAVKDAAANVVAL
ncbi:MAG TPA: hypothetical protein VMS11_04530 [Solirubrobacterales bacterium]|nr:hypothetical protein [Solirubrobacterales bacterium]